MELIIWPWERQLVNINSPVIDPKAGEHDLSYRRYHLCLLWWWWIGMLPLFAVDFRLSGIEMHSTFIQSNQTMKIIIFICNANVQHKQKCFDSVLFRNGTRMRGHDWECKIFSVVFLDLVPTQPWLPWWLCTCLRGLKTSLLQCCSHHVQWIACCYLVHLVHDMSCLKVTFPMLHSVIQRTDILINGKHLIFTVSDEWQTSV